MAGAALLNCWCLPCVAQQTYAANAGITSPAVADVITGTATVCAGSAITLKHAGNGGAWSSSNNSVATVTQTGIVSGVAAGDATIFYTADNGSAAVTVAVAVKPLPDAGAIKGTTTICQGTAGTLAAAVAGAGGVWSSSDNTIAVVSPDGIVTGIAPGSVNISYSVSNSCGADDAVAAITVPASPDAGTIVGPKTVCAGSSVALLTNGAAGGIWTSSNASVAAVNASGMVIGITPGVTTISYTFKSDCGVAGTATAITVNPLPNIDLIHGAPAVVSEGTVNLSNATAGGQWSSSDNTIAVVSPGGVVTGIAAGSVNISYSVSNSCGADDAIVSITISPSTRESLSGITAYGEASASPGSEPIGGEWNYNNYSNPGAATAAAGGAATEVTADNPAIFQPRHRWLRYGKSIPMQPQPRN